MTETTRQTLQAIADRFGSPCYAYDLDHIRTRVADVRAALRDEFAISYAVKANPNPTLLRWMGDVVDQLDVSSGGEVTRALAAGWSPAQLSFTGPAKTDTELHLAVEKRIGHVIVESLDEAARLDGIVQANRNVSDRCSILLRITPTSVPAGFGSRMSGKPTQFGIDETDIDSAIGQIRATMPRLTLDGFHVYAGTQCLNADAIVENVSATLTLFTRLVQVHALRPRTLVIGSGFGIPYHENEQPFDLASTGTRIVEHVRIAREQSPSIASATLVLETGRYLVGESGHYLTRVVTTKRSRGVDVLICDGGMNHHLAAAGHLGSVIRRNYRMENITATGSDMQPFLMYGPLCTSIDLLGSAVSLTPTSRGDVIAIAASGAYGLTASPVHFISHPLPREICYQAGLDGSDQFFDAATSQLRSS